MDKEGRIQPRVTLFDGLFRQDNPYLPKLDFTYRTLALRMRDAQCDNCHMPNNPMPMRRLVLMHTPAHAAGEIARLMKAVREDRMPLDDTGIEQPLEPGAQARAARKRRRLRRAGEGCERLGSRAAQLNGLLPPVSNRSARHHGEAAFAWQRRRGDRIGAANVRMWPFSDLVNER